MKTSFFTQFLFAFFALLGGTIVAQETVLLNASEVTTGLGQNACVPISVSEFNQIVSMQWSLEWDPSVANYTGVELGANPLGLTQTSYNLFSESAFRLSWLQPMGGGITLPAETVLISICFDPNTDDGSSAMSFDGGFMPEFIREDFVELPFNTTNGSYTVQPGVTPDPILILPGDTNQDSVVTADDLLNIGLAFGANGPIQDNPQTNFMVQSAIPWEVTTPVSDVDYANIDANGDGSINVDDQLVMEANFGSSLPGADPGPDNNITTGAAISAQADLLNGGEFASIPLHLEDGDDDVDVGYGISFQVSLDDSLFDLDNFSFDASGSIMGDDLLTFIGRSSSNPEFIEISVVRKDQENSTEAFGLIGTLNVLTNPVLEDVTTTCGITTIRYIDKDENTFGNVATVNNLTIIAPLALQEPLWAKDLLISPNPIANGWLNIQGLANEVAELSIYSMNNQLLATYPGNTNRIDVSELPAGTYFIRFESLATSVVRRIVIH